MYESKLVSVIIPTYNSEKYIYSAIQSVILQSYVYWELIVVDDNSNDDTENIVRKFQDNHSNIYFIKLNKNSGGPSTPRNKGMLKAKGYYIAFLDSDDIWHKNKLKIQLGVLKESNSRFCFTDVKPFTDEKQILSLIDRTLIKPKHIYKKMTHNKLLKKNFIKSGSSVVCERTLVDGIWFNEDRRYSAIEDYLFWLQIHQKKGIKSIWVKEKLVFYRLSESSISKSKIAMIKKNYMLFKEYKLYGKPLGIKRFLYLSTYIFFSLFSLLKSNFENDC